MQNTKSITNKSNNSNKFFSLNLLEKKNEHNMILGKIDHSGIHRYQL